MLTRVTDRKIPCVYIHVYRITKTRNQREAHVFYLEREVGKFGHVLAKKKVTL